MHMDSERETDVHSRRDVEQHIEELIAFLDALDGDPDLEEEGDNEEGADLGPTMGAAGSHWGSDHVNGWSRPTPLHSEECEDTNEDGGNTEDQPQHDESDSEPTLGAPENPEGDQTHWAQGDRFDLGEGEAGISDDDNPAVMAAARARSYRQRT